MNWGTWLNSQVISDHCSKVMRLKVVFELAGDALAFAKKRPHNYENFVCQSST